MAKPSEQYVKYLAVLVYATSKVAL